MGHDELHADVVRDGGKVKSLDRNELEDAMDIPVLTKRYYYPHFVASYARDKRDKWTQYVEEYERDKGLRRHRE